jgi:ABC-type Mn2+/Zn2+ transport system ATPase subunit
MKFGPFNTTLERLKIKNLDLDLSSKTSHLWGKNGVGKSTLMNLIIQELEAKKINFCYINQNYRANWFWWQTVRENLELAMNKSSNKYYHYKKIEELPVFNVNKAWLEPLLSIDFKQVNYSTANELESIGLSGGQLQRVLLFRELLLKPKVVFLDEAFSALDKKVATELINWLLQEQQMDDFKIISISHDPEIVEQMPGDIFELTQNLEQVLEVKKVTKLN